MRLTCKRVMRLRRCCVPVGFFEKAGMREFYNLIGKDTRGCQIDIDVRLQTVCCRLLETPPCRNNVLDGSKYKHKRILGNTSSHCRKVKLRHPDRMGDVTWKQQ